MPKGKNFTIFFLSRIVNHPNTTLFDVFEKSFLMKFTGKHRQNLSLIQTFFIPIQPRKQDSFWPVMKNFRKTKKDRDRRQRTDDLSPILPDSHGHPDISSILWFGSMPDYSRWFFPTVRIHSSVIWSVPACLCFHSTTFPRVLQQKLPLINPNKTATHVDKTETNRAFCYLHRTFLYLSALVWWESGFVCQRRSAILI